MMIDDDNDDEIHRNKSFQLKCYPYLYLTVSFLVFCGIADTGIYLSTLIFGHA
jgi:hypothetical protein